MKWMPIEIKHLEQILFWRQLPHVTKVMFTNVENDMEKQKKWFEKIQAETSSEYFVMEVDGVLIGVVSYSEIDRHNKRAIWHFYIGDENYLMLGAFIDAYVYNYAFEVMGLEKVICEVMDNNDSIQRIRKKYNVRHIGILEKHILKNNNWHDVYLYEITKGNWFETRGKFGKYKPHIDIIKGG